MPLYTGPELLAEVRDYADEPDDGDQALAPVTDAMIYRRLSTAYRRVRRHVARAGNFFERTTSSGSTATITLGSAPMVITGVYHVVSNQYRALRRKVDGVADFTATGQPLYWEPVISASGSSWVVLVSPTPSSGTVVVQYIAEPAAISSGTTNLFLPDTWKDAVVLEAAVRCYARHDGDNHLLRMMRQEAMEDLDADVAQLSDNGVIRNVDDVYPPGDDNRGGWPRDPSDFWWGPA